MKHNRALDGLRGLAIVLVIAFHGGWLPFGWVGVQLFFVLSGYLITSILLETRSLSASGYFSRFYWRRTLRIMPLYYAFLLVATVLFVAFNLPAGLNEDWPYLVTYTHNFARAKIEDVKTFSHFWSLAVEEQFYLMWPAVVWFARGVWLKQVVISLVVLGPLLRGLTAYAVGWLAGSSFDVEQMARAASFSLFGHIDGFAAGALVAIVPLERGFTRIRLGLSLALLVLLSGLAMVIVRYLDGGVYWLTFGYPHKMVSHYQYLWGFTVLNLFFASLVGCCHQGNILGSWIEAKPLRYLGHISYGLYIFHYPIFEAVARLQEQWLHEHSFAIEIYLLIPALMVSIGISHLSWKYFESFFLKYKKLL